MRDRKSRFIRAFTVFVSGQKEKCYDPLSSCSSDVEGSPSGSSNLAISEGKTPLVLLHG